MFREMRRKKQILSNKENIEILEKGTSGVLALLGDNEYPYAVPISYVYDNSKVYFHGAKTGHKIDAIRKCSKASFCVISQDEVVPEEYTTYFRSVIIFGKIRILEDENEIREAIEKLAIKYRPTDSIENRKQEIAREWKPLCMMELSVEYMTGKVGTGKSFFAGCIANALIDRDIPVLMTNIPSIHTKLFLFHVEKFSRCHDLWILQT